MDLVVQPEVGLVVQQEADPEARVVLAAVREVLAPLAAALAVQAAVQAVRAVVQVAALVVPLVVDPEGRLLALQKRSIVKEE